MQKEWEEFWQPFLDAKKLNAKVEEMNSLEETPQIESICHKVFDDYDSYSQKLNDVRLQFVQEVEHLPGVHLQTSRVKSLESILEKIINKRYMYLLDDTSLYSSISGDNYANVLTDLVGVRLIISYRGEWINLHEQIVNKFPYRTEKEYTEYSFIPHIEGESFIAEIPVAYYAYGDSLDIYRGARINTRLKESGYRSVHYVISYQNVYIELQTRTIFDEAWSVCDHSYVYKHDENMSYSVLKSISDVLCKYTNAASDLGDLMHELYNNSFIVDSGEGRYEIQDESIKLQIKNISHRFEVAQEEFKEFLNHLRLEDSDNDK